MEGAVLCMDTVCGSLAFGAGVAGTADGALLPNKLNLRRPVAGAAADDSGWAGVAVDDDEVAGAWVPPLTDLVQLETKLVNGVEAGVAAVEEEDDAATWGVAAGAEEASDAGVFQSLKPHPPFFGPVDEAASSGMFSSVGNGGNLRPLRLTTGLRTLLTLEASSLIDDDEGTTAADSPIACSAMNSRNALIQASEASLLSIASANSCFTFSSSFLVFESSPRTLSNSAVRTDAGGRPPGGE